MEHYVVTIARGFGSGGKQIASKLAKQLGIHCYENRILTLASQYSGLKEADFEQADERLRGGYWAARLKEFPGSLTPRPVMDTFRSDSRLFEVQKKIIEDLADTESCVIVGKCADYILKERKNVVSVYIEAPRPYCRENIMNRMGVSASEADKLISRTDRYRAEYYRFYSDGNYWTNPVNYDITLNSDRVGEDNCVEVIKQMLRIKLGVEIG